MVAGARQCRQVRVHQECLDLVCDSLQEVHGVGSRLALRPCSAIRSPRCLPSAPKASALAMHEVRRFTPLGDAYKNRSMGRFPLNHQRVYAHTSPTATDNVVWDIEAQRHTPWGNRMAPEITSLGNVSIAIQAMALLSGETPQTRARTPASATTWPRLGPCLQASTSRLSGRSTCNRRVQATASPRPSTPHGRQ